MLHNKHVLVGMLHWVGHHNVLLRALNLVLSLCYGAGHGEHTDAG